MIGRRGFLQRSLATIAGFVGLFAARRVSASAPSVPLPPWTEHYTVGGRVGLPDVSGLGTPTSGNPSSLFAVYLECGDGGGRLATALQGADEFGLRLREMEVVWRGPYRSLATGRMGRITAYLAYFEAEVPMDHETHQRFMKRIGCGLGKRPLDFWD